MPLENETPEEIEVTELIERISALEKENFETKKEIKLLRDEFEEFVATVTNSIDTLDRRTRR